MTSRVWTDIDFEESGKNMGHIFVPHSSDRSAYGSIAIDAGVIRNGQGPTALLMGGVHGDEYEAQVAIRRLFRKIHPGEIRGRILFFPSINQPACRAGRRVSPIDGLNLNRIFPGKAEGSPSEQIADYIETVLAPMSDVWFDYHSGGHSLDYIPMITRHHFGDENLNLRCDALLDAFGGESAFIWERFEEPKMAKSCAERHGVVYVASEFGGGATIKPDGIALCVEGTLRALQKMGVYHPAEGGPLSYGPHPKRFHMRGRSDHVVARDFGMFDCRVRLGENIGIGTLLGYVESFGRLDAEPVEVVSTIEGKIVCLRHDTLVEPGDVLLHIAHPERDPHN